jgi:membrane-bound serine protease (ClpP class)
VPAEAALMRTAFRRLVLLATFALFASAGPQFSARPQVAAPAQEPRAGRLALLLSVEGAIGPGVAGYLRDGLARAAERDAALAVVRLDTPGGLDSATRAIVRDILASPVPVAVWVAPSGARAASAGTFLLAAAHVAAMAPGTAAGAATPVRIGGGGGGGDPAAAKAVNDAAAYARGLAEHRGRDPDWVERAVREAASAPAEEALRLGAIDAIAADLPALLAAADGRTVRLPGGPVVLRTSGSSVEAFDPGWRHRLLTAISDPNIAYLLLLLGVYGLLFELATPGFGAGGVAGAIALLLGLFALNLLPVNLAGLALMGLGAALLTTEAFLPSFGVLGVGGVVALVLGATIAFDIGAPGFALSPTLAVGSAGLGALLLGTAAAAVRRSRRRPVVTGDAGMIGARGRVLAWAGGEGVVLLRGERWAAVAPVPLRPGDAVRVRARRGLRLEVAPQSPEEQEERSDP